MEKHGTEIELKDIQPGLFSMKLNLMYIADHVQIEHKKIALLAAKQEEHQIVHAVIDLMLTLLDNPLQNRRRIAHNIEKLEQNIKTNPKHLNTLADLAVLYRTINAEDKAVAIYETTNEILISNDQMILKKKQCAFLNKVMLSCVTNSPKTNLKLSTNWLIPCNVCILGNLLKDNKSYAVYRARAYACIGHRLVTRKEVHKEDLKHSSLSNDERFQVLMKDPLSAFDYANAEHAHDEIVLNRKGKSLLFVCKFRPETTENQKLKYLTEADIALSLSLSLNPRMDRLNFSVRMNVYFEMSILKNISNVSRYDFLQKALEDGKAAILVNLKGNDVCKVAEICQRLAKFPKFSYADQKLVYQCINIYCEQTEDLEFVNTLVPNSLWNEYLGKLLRFLDFLKTFPLTTKQVEIAEYLRNVLFKRTLNTVRQFRKYQYTPSTRNIEYEWRTSSFPHPVIEPASDHLDFEYDYFAIMSYENSGWIECFLQQQLNTQMLYNDRTFTACPDVINYESCSTLLETTINGINKSQKAILVLSNDFLTKEWNVMKSIITEMLQRRQGSLLVILLENCDVPPEIDSEHLLYFDFTDEKKIPMEIQNLKLALLSV
ncbi:unnamed protein product [Mytilus edulis]|uniref:TIR domain-containing protein n=1 Tax=Mytilus edulis TaxID=6550 RepID=A0A8S3PY30_MYTED|nr:unnamed protein product [Mytilus edulis]